MAFSVSFQASRALGGVKRPDDNRAAFSLRYFRPRYHWRDFNWISIE